MDTLADLKKAMVQYKDDLTPDAEEELRKKINEISVELGLMDKALLDIGKAVKITTTGVRGGFAQIDVGLKQTQVNLKATATAIGGATAAVKIGEKANKDLGQTMEGVWDEIANDIGNTVVSALYDFTTLANFFDQITKTMMRSFTTMLTDMAAKAASGTKIIAADFTTMAAAFGVWVIGNMAKGFAEFFEEDEPIKNTITLLNETLYLLEKINAARSIAAEDATTNFLFPERMNPKGSEVMAGNEDPYQTVIDNINKMITAEEGNVTASGDLEKAWNGLIDTVIDLGLEGDKQFVTLIQRMRELGIASKEVDAYVFGWLDKAASGLEAMVGGVLPDVTAGIIDAKKNLEDYKDALSGMDEGTKEWEDMTAKIAETETHLTGLIDSAAGSQGALDDIATLTLTTFNSMIAQGASMGEALAAIEGPLEALRAKYELFGLEGNAAIEKLFNISKVRAEHEALFTAIDGNAMALQALGNIGQLGQAEIDASANSAKRYYDDLKNAGLSAEEALAIMAPTLNDLNVYAERWSLSLDPATQALIDQADKAGLLAGEAKTTADIMEEGFDRVVGAIEGLISVLVGPGGVTDAFGQVGGAIDDLNNVDVTVGTRVGSTESSARSGPKVGAAHGFEGTVTGPYQFNVEPGVREHVQMTPIGAGGGGGVGGGESPALLRQLIEAVYASGGTVVIKPELDVGDALERFIIKFVPEATKNEELLIHPNGVRAS